MKRRLDLNGPGSKIIAGIAVFIILIPGTLLLARFVFGLLLIDASLLKTMTILSLASGGILFVSFIILLAFEAVQDRFFDRWYQRQRNIRLVARDGFYECQYCGCRRVKIFDRQCPSCGKTLIKESL